MDELDIPQHEIDATPSPLCPLVAAAAGTQPSIPNLKVLDAGRT